MIGRADRNTKLCFQSIDEPLFSDPVWEHLRRSLKLSRRELQIVKRVACDEKEQMIANKIGISKHTVHTYIERIYRKLNVNSRVGLIVTLVKQYQLLKELEIESVLRGKQTPRHD